MMILRIFICLLFFVLGCDSPSDSSKELPIVLHFDITNVSSYNGSNGSIDLTVTGDNPPFKYFWSNGDSTEDISNLTAGKYYVDVFDSDYNHVIDSVKVSQPGGPLSGRNYFYHIPPSYTGQDSVPLVIALHHYNRNGIYFEEYTNFSILSDEKGFIVLYPDATGSPSEWNVGIGLSPTTLRIDDVTFISTLIDKSLKDYNIDSSRVYIAGFSNGSIFTHLLADKLSDKIAAVGAVAGQPTYDIVDAFDYQRSVATIMIHMQDDQSLSYNGGILNGCGYPSVAEYIDTLITINNCQNIASVLDSNSIFIAKEWKAMDSNADIMLYLLSEGGHSWPDEHLKAETLIWNFFKSH